MHPSHTSSYLPIENTMTFAPFTISVCYFLPILIFFPLPQSCGSSVHSSSSLFIQAHTCPCPGLILWPIVWTASCFFLFFPSFSCRAVPTK
ncbi:uncharacterized protein BJ171DRAFT_282246 [Polychytrium aggregatum]|uniref:uncharacterized protein n=1 Tax=Polychytrium aggregatum TaxID=110093 RepID=UPI0022FE0C53|nr:uncharacterized protein BJ171DRAFT_282246 [Polychytrium aggregatum]KAI9193251.1 hypothetical protein BJ171DRAFT_282246 [Polychytrium aggregatum]